MKKFFVVLAVSSAFVSHAFAQSATSAPSSVSKAASATMGNPAPSAAAPEAMCKDGTAPVGKASHSCRGHGGLMTTAMSPANTAGATTAPAAAGKAAPSQVTPMVGGGAGKVWVNTSTKVYHCEGDRYYGKTKKGAYMSEADARTKGFHGEHGRTCSK